MLKIPTHLPVLTIAASAILLACTTPGVEGSESLSEQRQAIEVPPDVEDVVVFRSVRVSRVLPPAQNGVCAAAGLLGKTGAADQHFELWSVKTRNNTAMVVDNQKLLVGTMEACTAASATAGVLDFYGTGHLDASGNDPAIDYAGSGTCRSQGANSPVTGITRFVCMLNLTSASAPYVGGQLASNTISSLNINGDETNPPGYVQSSIAVVRLWKPLE